MLAGRRLDLDIAGHEVSAGTATITRVGPTLLYRIDVAGLSNASAAHIHGPAAAGVNAGQMPLSVSWSSADPLAGVVSGDEARIDAVKALQQRWQAEAQTVPLDRKHEQKLWDTFRKPIEVQHDMARNAFLTRRVKPFMLRRTKAGPFTLEGAISLDKLSELAKARQLEQALLPLTAGLDDIPALSVTPDQARALRQGRKLAGIAAKPGLHLATELSVPVALVEFFEGELRVVRGFNF